MKQGIPYGMQGWTLEAMLYESKGKKKKKKDKDKDKKKKKDKEKEPKGLPYREFLSKAGIGFYEIVSRGNKPVEDEYLVKLAHGYPISMKAMTDYRESLRKAVDGDMRMMNALLYSTVVEEVEIPSPLKERLANLVFKSVNVADANKEAKEATAELTEFIETKVDSSEEEDDDEDDDEDEDSIETSMA